MGVAPRWRVGYVGAPAQCGDHPGNRLLVALDRSELITDPLAHLLWAIGPTSSTPHKRDRLLALPFIGVHEQTRDPILGEHGLGGTL